MQAPAIGVFLPTMTERGALIPDVREAARHAENLGFESAWVVDQLVAGTGVPFLESTVALTAAAAVTDRIRLAYGVLILPLRSPVWVAKHVASMQQISGNRVILGVGVGGDRHGRSWAAAGVPRSERGRRTDDALDVVADLIAGKRADVDGAAVQLAPGANVPPIIVGGIADTALARAVRHGDGWFALPLPAPQVAASMARLAETAAALGRATPPTTGSIAVAIEGDPDLQDRDALVRRLTDPDGMYGMPVEVLPDIVVAGPLQVVTERIAALGELGVERVVVSLVAGNWWRQAELLAQAVGGGQGVTARNSRRRRQGGSAGSGLRGVARAPRRAGATPRCVVRRCCACPPQWRRTPRRTR
jgi:alkanesulfonate monooxygenase SsuD/methylene tetrahydromethanopterin reductase-like flavin-dependent oxidoreductase (luciferase family)